MIGHPRRKLRLFKQKIFRFREICHMLKWVVWPDSYRMSLKWGCLYSDSGQDNIISISSWCCGNLMLLINGNNNHVTIGKNVRFGPRCAILIDGDDCEVHIGDNCSFTRKLHMAVTASHTKCIVNEDCMFSYNIVVRTDDAHPVYDTITKQRVNYPSDTIVGEHVWIGPNSTISKGVHIGDHSVIAQNSVVTKNIPSDVLVAGVPAIVKKQNIFWTKIESNNPFEKCEVHYVPDLKHKMYDEWLC